jgi:hypothetical protein
MIALVALSLLLGAGLAMGSEASSPQYGGCIVQEKSSSGKPCDPKLEDCKCLLQAGVAVAVTVAKYAAGKFTAGLLPGIGYGVVLFPERWYSLGLASYGQLMVGGENAYEASVSGLVSFARYLRFGIGSDWTGHAGGSATRDTVYLIGAGSDYGGSSTYTKSQVH